MSVSRKPRIVIRNSRVHGRGVYAARKIAAGERIIEYKGERITWKEADRRPPSDPDDPHHTFFFSLSDGKTVIDAASRGNAARLDQSLVRSELRNRGVRRWPGLHPGDAGHQDGARS